MRDASLLILCRPARLAGAGWARLCGKRVRARNRLLTDLRRADPAWIGALEAQMDEHGTALRCYSTVIDAWARASPKMDGHPRVRLSVPLQGDGLSHVEAADRAARLPLQPRADA